MWVESSASPHSPAPPNTTPPGEGQFGEREAGCAQEGRTQREAARFPPPFSGEPLCWPPGPRSRSTLTFRQPWSSSVVSWLSWPAFLQMDGKDWLQGLSFQRPSWEHRLRGSLSPPPPNLPNPSQTSFSKPDPASACCVILSKKLDLSVFQAIKRGK